MNKKILPLILLVAALLLPTVIAQTEQPASVRYVSVEEITYEDNYPENEGTPVACTHFTYTFGLYKVDNWGDRCYYVAYVMRGGEQVVVARWSVGFSATGGLQGIYIDYATDLLTVITTIAEFPYNTTEMTNPIDGTQAYSFYRMDFYFRGELFVNEVVTIAADYMQQPIITTDTLFASASSTVYTGSKASYQIQDTTPEGFTFTLLSSPFVTPESPLGTAMLLTAAFAAVAVVSVVKRRTK